MWNICTCVTFYIRASCLVCLSGFSDMQFFYIGFPGLELFEKANYITFKMPFLQYVKDKSFL